MNRKTQKFSWWIEILTNKPSYIYYFGPFDNYWEAKWSTNGYIQDLEREKAEIVDIQIEQCEPKELTIAIRSTRSNPLSDLNKDLEAQSILNLST